MNRYILYIVVCFNFSFAQNALKHQVFFETDAYVLVQDEQQKLDQYIDKIKAVNLEKIVINGFCDDVGSASYNLTLSKQRAEVIKTVFSKQNINDSIIRKVNGKGEISLNSSPKINANTIRSYNRKVEIIAYPLPEIIKENSDLDVVVDVPKGTIESFKGDLIAGDKITLEHIFFNNGYSNASSESHETLNEIAAILKEKKGIYFTIQGHVCCTLNARDAVDIKTNKRNLSQARAKYVYNYLAKQGVSKSRMKYVGMRRKFPLGGDPKLDRRVEILITYVSENN